MIHIAYKKQKPSQGAGRAKETYPHFRRYKFEEGGQKKKAKHPKLIVDKEQNQYGFMGLTESSKRGHHHNLPLSQNPQKGRTAPAYIRTELRYDSVEHFGEILTDYRLSKEDKRKVLEYAAKLKQKKKK